MKCYQLDRLTPRWVSPSVDGPDLAWAVPRANRDSFS